MRRRTLLSALGGLAASLAGCTGGTGTPGTGDGTATPTDDPSESTDLPEACPTSQGLAVEWPEDLDADTVEAFVEAYEHEYFRDFVVEYEPASRLDSYELDGSVSGPARAVGDGWVLEYRGGGGVYRPTLLMSATTSDSPEGADVVPVDEIEDEPLTRLLEEAAETGEAEYHVERRSDADIDRYLDVLASASADFGRLARRGDSDSLYVDVDSTTVELTVSASDFHGDYWWSARYYVDERAVRRTTDEETDPRDGELLECREPG